MREIEIKLKANNLDIIEKRLKDLGCNLSDWFEQKDAVYTSVNNPRDIDAFIEGDIAIRIRKEKDKIKLTLKQQKTPGLDKIEHETEIKDLGEVHSILTILGWKPIIEIIKKRKKGILGKYEVCLDMVEGLGSYVEIEKMTTADANPEEVRKELFNEAKKIGLSQVDEEKRGYDIIAYLLNNKK